MNASENNVPAARRSRIKRWILLIGVPVCALLIIGVLYLNGGRYVETDNAYVKADKIPISAEVSGRIKNVMVQENEEVVAGQPLFQIDSAPFDLAVAKAEARLAQVKTDLAALKASYKEKQAEIELAKTRNNFAKKNQARQADLMAKKFTSTSTFESAQETADLTDLQITALEQDLNRIGQALGGSVDAPFEQHPGYLAARAELDQALLDQARTIVRAPLPGVISKPPKPGQFAAAGVTALALVVNGNLWIEANFTETDLTYVHPGQSVSIHVDTYPDQEWEGEVESLSPATGAEFSLIPAQNATGNWVKISQRVPVRIHIASHANQPDLRAGFSAEVEIDTQHRRKFLGVSL